MTTLGQRAVAAIEFNYFCNSFVDLLDQKSIQKLNQEEIIGRHKIFLSRIEKEIEKIGKQTMRRAPATGVRHVISIANKYEHHCEEMHKILSEPSPNFEKLCLELTRFSLVLFDKDVLNEEIKYADWVIRDSGGAAILEQAEGKIKSLQKNMRPGAKKLVEKVKNIQKDSLYLTRFMVTAVMLAYLIESLWWALLVFLVGKEDQVVWEFRKQTLVFFFFFGLAINWLLFDILQIKKGFDAVFLDELKKG